MLSKQCINWYCELCHPTLNTYVSMPRIESALSNMQNGMSDVKKILFENFTLTKQTNSKQLAENTEVAARLKKEIQIQCAKVASGNDEVKKATDHLKSQFQAEKERTAKNRPPL